VNGETRTAAVRITLVLTALAAAVVLILMYLYIYSPSSVLSNVALGNEVLPVSVTVYGRGSDTISARVAFYTADGTMLNTFERSWPGWEISIESYLARSGSGWIVFPLTVMTDETRPGQGVDVTRYYSIDDFPAIYERSSLSRKEHNALSRFFTLARGGFCTGVLKRRFRLSKATLRQFENSVEYFLYVDGTGAVTFR